MPYLFAWSSVTPWFPIGAGIAACLALIALQFLRSRPERRKVAALMFWQMAAVPQRARTLWSARMSRIGSLAILLAIVALLAASLLIDSVGASDGVVLIDHDRAMAEADAAGRTRFANAVDAAVTFSELTGRSPAVLTRGNTIVLQTPAGVPARVAVHGLRSQSPDTGTSDTSGGLVAAAQLSAGPIDWFTSHAALPAGLPDDVAGRVRLHHVPSPSAVRISEGFISPAARGVCKVVIGVTSSDTRRSQCELRIDTGREPATVREVLLNAGRGELMLDGMPADGRRLKLDVVGQTAPPVTLTMPTLPVLRIWFAESVPAPLREALLSLGERSASRDAADLIVGGDAGALPNVQIVRQQRGELMPIAFAAGPDGDRVLEGARALSPQNWPADDEVLLRAGDGAVAGMSTDGRTLRVAESLVSPDAELPRRAAFVTLLQAWCDRLTGRLPAGAVVTVSRVGIDPIWKAVGVTPNVVDDAAGLPAALTDSAPLPSHRGPSWATWLLLGGLAVTVVEGALWARRKIV